MKSKYLCPVCGESLRFQPYPEFDNQCIVNCVNFECNGRKWADGTTEHLAYEKLLERVKGEGK